MTKYRFMISYEDNELMVSEIKAKSIVSAEKEIRKNIELDIQKIPPWSCWYCGFEGTEREVEDHKCPQGSTDN